MGCPETTLENKRGVRPDEHGYGSGAARGPGVSASVDGDVGADGDGVTAVPVGRLHPGDAVEESGCAAVAGVGGVDALNVAVAAVLKQLQE